MRFARRRIRPELAVLVALVLGTVFFDDWFFYILMYLFGSSRSQELFLFCIEAPVLPKCRPVRRRTLKAVVRRARRAALKARA